VYAADGLLGAGTTDEVRKDGIKKFISEHGIGEGELVITVSG
jgi:hypothetical protein